MVKGVIIHNQEKPYLDLKMGRDIGGLGVGEALNEGAVLGGTTVFKLIIPFGEEYILLP